MRATLLTMLLCLATAAWAQDNDLEYKIDLGGGLGAATPAGDAGDLFSSIGPEAHFVVRRIFNQRMALKANLTGMRLTGSTDGYFPIDANTPGAEGGEPASQSWKRGVMDLGCVFELNFWGYGSGPKYKGNSPITPYIAAGVGMTMAMGGGGKTAAGFNIPVAVGLKYRLRPRLNLELEWRVSFTTTDRIDDTASGLKLCDPYGVKSGMMKNKDCYSTIAVSLTFDTCPKLRKCNN